MNYLLNDFLTYCEAMKDLGAVTPEMTVDQALASFKKAMAEMDITELDTIEDTLDEDNQINFFDE